MKRFIFGLLGFVVVWIVGLAPQFLAYVHVSGIIIFALEGGVSIAAYLLYVRLLEKRSVVELSRFRIALLPLGTLVGLVWFGLLIVMLYAGGHYQVNRLAFPNRLLSAIIFALGTAIWEEVTFRGLLFRITEQTFGTWVGVAVSPGKSYGTAAVVLRGSFFSNQRLNFVAFSTAQTIDDSLNLVRSLRNLEHGTLTLMRPIPKGTTIQSTRSVAFALVTVANNVCRHRPVR